MKSIPRCRATVPMTACALLLASCASTSLYRETFVRTPTGAGRYAPSHEPTEPGGPNTYVSGRSLPEPMFGKLVQYTIAAPFALAWDVVTAPVQVVLGCSPYAGGAPAVPDAR